MFARPAAIIGWILLVACEASLAGQVPLVGPGSRVRLRTLTAGRVEGIVVRVSADTVILASSVGPIVMRPGTLQSVEIYRGTRREWRSGAEIGAFAGFVGTAEVFAARMRRCIAVECARIAQWETEAAAGSLVGAVVGGLVGAAFQHERWERGSVGPVRPQVAIGAGTESVGLSIRY